MLVFSILFPHSPNPPFSIFIPPSSFPNLPSFHLHSSFLTPQSSIFIPPSLFLNFPASWDFPPWGD